MAGMKPIVKEKQVKEIAKVMEAWAEDVQRVLTQSRIVSLEGVYEDGTRVQWATFNDFVIYYSEQREWLPVAEKILALANMNPESER